MAGLESIFAMQDIIEYAPAPSAHTQKALGRLYSNAEARQLLPGGLTQRPRLGARLLTQRCMGALVGALAGELTVSLTCSCVQLCGMIWAWGSVLKLGQQIHWLM